MKGCNYGGDKFILCRESSCHDCIGMSVCSLPDGRYKHWNYRRNGYASPREISLYSSFLFWFTCPICKTDIRTSIQRASDPNKPLCEKCGDGKATTSQLPIIGKNEKVEIHCIQGHSYRISPGIDLYRMKTIKCMFCDIDTEMMVKDFLESIYVIEYHPTFRWSIINKNGEYMTYTFAIRPLDIIIELKTEGGEIDLYPAKTSRAISNQYSIIIIDTYLISSNSVDWRVLLTTNIKQYVNPKSIKITSRDRDLSPRDTSKRSLDIC
jgi:hypothetical protein